MENKALLSLGAQVHVLTEKQGHVTGEKKKKSGTLDKREQIIMEIWRYRDSVLTES